MASFMDRVSEGFNNWMDLANHTPKPADHIRDEFMADLARFYEDGTEPARASFDMRYYLHQHEKRLAEKGVKIQRRYTPDPKGVKHSVSRQRPPYTSDLAFIDITSSSQYTSVASSKILQKHKKATSIFYANVLDRQDLKDAAYVCPNCGHQATLEIFSNGCPMCGTRFQMSQLFPCVSNFYMLPQMVSSKTTSWLKPTVITMALLIAFGLGGYTTFSQWNSVDSHTIAIVMGAGATLLGGFLGAVISYLTCSIFLAFFMFGRMATQAVTTVDTQTAALTKKSLTNAMKRFDPEFSYEFFEGKVLSLFRAIVFSEDRANMSIYRGEPNIPDLDNIIDVSYRGAMKFLNLTVQNGNDLVLLVRVYLYNTYLINGKIVQKKEDFNMTLVKKLTAQENLGFSIHAVNCKSCAASFDAMHLLQCPSCGAPYHLEEEDWVVVGMKR
ncbi:MAG: hypothetical protein J6Y08_03035 [Clostridiales bacterium]|nr:hypothetical protein [Clostridiales bacterium]